jgi:hypothetical protein
VATPEPNLPTVEAVKAPPDELVELHDPAVQSAVADHTPISPGHCPVPMSELLANRQKDSPNVQLDETTRD